MASLEIHCGDCARILGDRCEDVNRWLDECFAGYGPLHRIYRHHSRGVEESYGLFGERGRKAALIHILRDCGHIPTEQQWLDKQVDSLGIDLKGPFLGHWNDHEFILQARKLLERVR